MDVILLISILVVLSALVGIGALAALFCLSESSPAGAHQTVTTIKQPVATPQMPPGVPKLAIETHESPVAVVTVSHEQGKAPSTGTPKLEPPQGPTSNMSSPKSIPSDWFQKDAGQREESPTFSEILRQSIASHSNRRSEAK